MFNKIIIKQVVKTASRFTTFITLGAYLAIVSHSVTAATLAQEKKAFADIKANVSSLETNIVSINAAIKATEADVKKHYIKIAPLRKKLDKADATLIAARAASTSNPTDSNKAKTSNAEFKYVLAERKYKKIETKLAKAETKLEKLKKQKIDTAKKLSSQRKSLVVQERRVKEWKPRESKRQVAAKPKPAPVRKPQPKPKKLPIAKTLPIAKATPVLKPSRAKPSISKPSSNVKQNEVLQLAEKTVQKTPKVVNTKPATSSKSTTVKALVAAKSKGPVEPEEQREKREDQAMVFKDRLDDLLDSTNKRKRAAFPNELMTIEIIKANGQKYKVQIKLEHIKEQRYSGTAKMFAGNVVLKVAKTQWSKKVPAWDDGKTYQFIYDGREGIGPVMTWYRTDLAR